MLPGLGGEGAFAAVEIEKPDVVRFHGASEVRPWNVMSKFAGNVIRLRNYEVLEV